MVGEDDVSCEAELAKQGDDDAVQVYLAFAQAMESGARIAMMVVVEAVTKRERGKDVIVLTLVSHVVVLVAEGVAEGVDSPNRVLEEHGAEAGGQHASPGIGEAAKSKPYQRRDGEREHGPDVVRSVEEADHGVAHQVAAVDASVSDGVIEHPADVGVEEAFERVSVETVAIDDGAVGVAAVVSLCVVTAVIGDPGEERTLEGHGAGGAQ